MPSQVLADIIFLRPDLLMVYVSFEFACSNCLSYFVQRARLDNNEPFSTKSQNHARKNNLLKLTPKIQTNLQEILLQLLDILSNLRWITHHLLPHAPLPPHSPLPCRPTTHTRVPWTAARVTQNASSGVVPEFREFLQLAQVLKV